MTPPATHPIEQVDVPASPDERDPVRNAMRDLEAARRRVERDAAKVRDETRNQLVAELFPVLDNLDRSIAAGAADDPMLQGVKQVRSQLLGVLEGYGLERFDALGAKFDPTAHDAIAMVDVAEPARAGVVVDQIEAGYRSGEKLLRPAKVAVGRYTAPAPVPEDFAPPTRDLTRERIDALRALERTRAAAQVHRRPVAPWDPWRGIRRR